jgi:MSHA biogenesis protein MshI
VLSFLRSSPRSGKLAIAAGGDHIDLVQIERRRDAKPRVTRADSFAYAGDLPATLAALKKKQGLARYRCTMLLPHGKYQLLPVAPPEGPAAERAEALRWTLKDMVDFPVDNASIDVLDIPGDARGQPQVFAAIAPEAVIAPMIQAFQAAGVGLDTIDLPELSQRNLAALFEEDGRGLATLIFDDDEGLLTFTGRGELYVARHIDITARQLASASAERRGQLYDRVALDVQRSLDNFDRTMSHVAVSRLLVGPLPGAEGFLDFLRSNLLLPVEAMEVASVLDLGAVPALLDPLRQSQCMRALGAALREA